MRPQKPIPDLPKIVVRYLANEPLTALARDYSLSPTTLYRRLNAHPDVVEAKKSGKFTPAPFLDETSKVDPESLIAAVEDVHCGMSTTDAALKYGISQSYVSEAYRKAHPSASKAREGRRGTRGKPLPLQSRVATSARAYANALERLRVLSAKQPKGPQDPNTHTDPTEHTAEPSSEDPSAESPVVALVPARDTKNFGSVLTQRDLDEFDALRSDPAKVLLVLDFLRHLHHP